MTYRVVAVLHTAKTRLWGSPESAFPHLLHVVSVSQSDRRLFSKPGLRSFHDDCAVGSEVPLGDFRESTLLQSSNQPYHQQKCDGSDPWPRTRSECPPMNVTNILIGLSKKSFFTPYNTYKIYSLDVLRTTVLSSFLSLKKLRKKRRRINFQDNWPKIMISRLGSWHRTPACSDPSSTFLSTTNSVNCIWLLLWPTWLQSVSQHFIFG